MPLRRVGSLVTTLSLLTAGLWAQATIYAAHERAWIRFQQQCADGNGKACYDYGRARWSTPGQIDRKIARRYLVRACDLKYTLACKSLADHNKSLASHSQRHTAGYREQLAGPCFSSVQMHQAKMLTVIALRSGARGQRINKITPGSFWDHAGLMEDDVIVSVDGKFATSQQNLRSALNATKDTSFNFKIERGDEPVTVVYTCNK